MSCRLVPVVHAVWFALRIVHTLENTVATKMHHIPLKSNHLGGKGMNEAAELLCAEQNLPLLKISLGLLA